MIVTLNLAYTKIYGGNFMTIKFGSKGATVSFFQTILNSLNIYQGNIDGIFGINTKNAVIDFQKMLNVSQTGEINDTNVKEFYPYIFVPTNIEYNYEIVTIITEALVQNFKFISKEIIGKSIMNKNIYCIKIGEGSSHVIYVASTHANEWITTPTVLKFIFDFANAYSNGEMIFDTPAYELFAKSTIHIVPLLNPDGVDLVTNSLDSSSAEYIKAVEISENYPNIFFPDGWKANISGVDLNLQFPAKWDTARQIKFAQGYTSPAPRDFVGDYPLQAVEALCIYDYILTNPFKLLLTFHTQGQVIYWQFLNYMPPNAENIAIQLEQVSSYMLETTPYGSSFAGLKDWYIQNFNLPGYTIEAGLGTNPLPLTQLDQIYSECLKIMVRAASLV